MERSGTLGHPNPRDLAPTGRMVTTRTLFRAPFQGTEDVVWRDPRGSTPGCHRLRLRAMSTVRTGLHAEFPVLRSQFPVPTGTLCKSSGREPSRTGSWVRGRPLDLHPDVAYATSGCKSRRNDDLTGRDLQTRVAYATRNCKSVMGCDEAVGSWVGRGLVVGWSWVGRGVVLVRSGNWQLTSGNSVCRPRAPTRRILTIAG